MRRPGFESLQTSTQEIATARPGCATNSRTSERYGAADEAAREMKFFVLTPNDIAANRVIFLKNGPSRAELRYGRRANFSGSESLSILEKPSSRRWRIMNCKCSRKLNVARHHEGIKTLTHAVRVSQTEKVTTSWVQRGTEKKTKTSPLSS